MYIFNYLAFEGGEGSGKTVLSKSFAKRIGAFWTYEPSGETELLKTLRNTALTQNKQMSVMGREMLMIANRSIHNQEIIRPLIGNKIVTDRSFFSGMVYANIHNISFEEWFKLFKMAKIEYLPKRLIFVRNSERRIDKEKDNIYDHASAETLSQIDISYEKGLQFIKNFKGTKEIDVLEFTNDFTLPVEENVDRLLHLIQKNLKEIS